ncbi:MULTISPECIES: NAD(P)/FAD-dependent oxidoreductase [Halocynthiibacter]|uniref:FAD-dependent oxidoreductase n=1 Tax=Halocynthiibacter halioticoli TaxID=2986804 RepID=A0AAE3IWP0_9RHOB|nr:MULTISPECIES: FAD-dependent oxidoreductase [Halocynthiibacter]MCV6823099.1 FAD-dependent oxidoreductase [Halocynthiibacter halioticoli]MCW4056100.1 FAD-dependent oxidoreductase [Halocynthiibacter sp. SDUM655004]
MSFDIPHSEPKRVAIIGGGISGLAAAYLLSTRCSVTLFEAGQKLGGHARTIHAGRNGNQPVDTGFIVFNKVNYPHLTKMFEHLDVPIIKSDMSFGATIDDGRVEYGLATLGALFAQKRNLLRPGFARMIRDIGHFNSQAEKLATDDSATIGELMDDLRVGEWFRRFYLLPLCGAIWSTPPSKIRDFPAHTLVQFFRNHALLSATGQHQWWTVKGGSREYVSRLEHYLRARGVALRTGTPVSNVVRKEGGVTIQTSAQAPEQFDEVIFACHSDQALKLLQNPTPDEIAALSAIRFQDNEVILHRDETQMPLRRSVWSSWVYRANSTKDEPKIGVTYWMNRLQAIPENDPLFVSLNPLKPVPDELIYDQKTFRHPVFDGAALKAQHALKSIQGQNRTWFAGAYTRHGFHEDGFASAVRIADAMEMQTA